MFLVVHHESRAVGLRKSKKPAEPLPPWQDVKEEPWQLTGSFFLQDRKLAVIIYDCCEEYQKLVVRRNQQLQLGTGVFVHLLCS